MANLLKNRNKLCLMLHLPINTVPGALFQLCIANISDSASVIWLKNQPTSFCLNMFVSTWNHDGVPCMDTLRDCTSIIDAIQDIYKLAKVLFKFDKLEEINADIVIFGGICSPKQLISYRIKGITILVYFRQNID